MKCVMAAGRGRFFQSFLEGLERTPAQPAAGPGTSGRGTPGRGTPGPGTPGRGTPGRGTPGPGGGQAGGQRVKRRPKAAPSSDNLMERLPSEVLIKILSYLDASSLFCISHVSKLFHRLANDDYMWHKIYTSEFGSQLWKPKLGDVEADQSAGHWKKMYFRTMAGQEMDKWRRALRGVSPSTGLPRQTEWVLRKLNVSWELTVCDRLGREVTLEQSGAFFFQSSVVVRWSAGSFPKYHHISHLRLHGVRRETAKSPDVRKPGWRSLVSQLDAKTRPGRFIGKDRLVRLMHLSPGFIVGVWRGQSCVAFIMVSLHLHRLVEKSLLGSPVCPYSEPADRPPADRPPEDVSDLGFRLHGYTLHFVLHNTSTEIMSRHFCQLSCHTGQIQRGLVELKAIDRIDVSQHRSLSGAIRLPWRSEALEGAVENCCIITLTLLDESQKPVWCVSSPITVKMARKAPSFDYGGEHFVMEHQDPEGQVRMRLVWLKEQRQFFLVSLSVYVSVARVNKHFS